ncbi:putative phage abortive infection protein [uncultured Imperialibacter sp.]|uniref:putative phage abortive infection protein n=1 Tax=uncultured Imperialibacter sp. TaxID=1672639 RepID=UPI0030DBE96F|tara:strand:- start:9186 stop:10091 length:906 start_codon:yes stop_codon:yes gene_type:complete
MSKPNPTRRSFFVTFLGASAALAVLAGFGIIYYVFNNVKNLNLAVEGDITTLSMLGEFIGGSVGTMWSLAGVIFFYLALIYQRRELELQREELLESRKIMDKQSKTLQTQQFENTFFQLLEFHLNAAKRIETQDGANGFDKMYVDFKKALTATKRKRKTTGSSQNLDSQSFETSFRLVYDSYRNTLSHYMESYKALLFLVDEKSSDPVFYVNIIKPHLTEQEVLMQFYYLLLYDKNERFKTVVENYGLFQRLNIRAVHAIDKLHLEELKETAYQATPEKRMDDSGKEEEPKKRKKLFFKAD